MRDGAIIDMQRKNAQRDGLILAQFQFLKTRQEAFELALLNASWKDRVRWAIWPEQLLDSVERIQGELIEKAKSEMAAQKVKAQIQRVSSLPPEVNLRG